MEQYSLTYDFGSGSLKAALVNAQHRIAASCNLAYSTIFRKRAGLCSVLMSYGSVCSRPLAN